MINRSRRRLLDFLIINLWWLDVAAQIAGAISLSISASGVAGLLALRAFVNGVSAQFATYDT